MEVMVNISEQSLGNFSYARKSSRMAVFYSPQHSVHLWQEAGKFSGSLLFNQAEKRDAGLLESWAKENTRSLVILENM
jgi:hypothetical protein